MFETCLQKQQLLIDEFERCKDVHARYEKIIAMGRSQVPLDKALKIPENLVQGCQSTMYLTSSLDEEGRIFFQTEADALISAGLGLLLTRVYSGEDPSVILKCPPSYLEKLELFTSLTPSRANGLASLYLKMKQNALQALLHGSPQS